MRESTDAIFEIVETVEELVREAPGFVCRQRAQQDVARVIGDTTGTVLLRSLLKRLVLVFRETEIQYAAFYREQTHLVRQPDVAN